MCIDSIFIKLVQHIFNNSTAEILMNRNISNPLNINKEFLKGWPLSPLLFTLATELFPIVIQSHP